MYFNMTYSTCDFMRILARAWIFPVSLEPSALRRFRARTEASFSDKLKMAKISSSILMTVSRKEGEQQEVLFQTISSLQTLKILFNLPKPVAFEVQTDELKWMFDAGCIGNLLEANEANQPFTFPVKVSLLDSP
jgi:hypothetical protein